MYAAGLQTSTNGGLYRIACLPEWCIIEYTILYLFYNLNCKRRTRTLSHVRLRMIVVVDQLNHMWRSPIWKLSYVKLHRKALRISYLSFTAWWLNKQDNINNNFFFQLLPNIEPLPLQEGTKGPIMEISKNSSRLFLDIQRLIFHIKSHNKNTKT